MASMFFKTVFLFDQFIIIAIRLFLVERCFFNGVSNYRFILVKVGGIKRFVEYFDVSY